MNQLIVRNNGQISVLVKVQGHQLRDNILSLTHSRRYIRQNIETYLNLRIVPEANPKDIHHDSLNLINKLAKDILQRKSQIHLQLEQGVSQFSSSENNPIVRALQNRSTIIC
jgi:hypothetical protein